MNHGHGCGSLLDAPGDGRMVEGQVVPKFAPDSARTPRPYGKLGRLRVGLVDRLVPLCHPEFGQSLSPIVIVVPAR